MVFATTPTQVAATAPSPTVPRKADLPGTGLPAALSNGGAGGAQAACGGERVSPAPSGAAIAGGVIPSGASSSASGGAGSTSAATATSTAGSSGNVVGNAANVGGPGPAVPAQSPAPAALPPPSLPPPYPSTMQVRRLFIIFNSIFSTFSIFINVDLKL